MSENKHLTLDERNIIEQELTKNTSFKEIAELLSKDPTTISKEVRKHMQSTLYKRVQTL